MNDSVQSATAIKRPESFQLKGGLFPMNLLEIKVADIKQIHEELHSKVSQAPAFFQNAPVVLGFEFLSEHEQKQILLEPIVALCKELGLLPCAVRGANNELQQEAYRLKLASMPKGRGKAKAVLDEAAPLEEPNKTTDSSAGTDPELSEHESITTRIISSPIRSGQQIYVANGDLIILSSVSPGAEVLADGNIHIYGALRGRALAGVKGDKTARIFCSSQEAELISIAGEFMVDENLKSNHWKESVQMRLVDDKISITTL